MKTGKTFIISGPSGVGKSTVLRELLRDRDDLYFSISATTRTPREGEINGVHYHFINVDRFREMIQEDEFLEYAEYVGNFYGTPKRYVDEAMAQGKDVILDIEVQGALQVIGKRPDTVRIFIAPPSWDALEQRLTGRGTDSPEKIQKRMMLYPAMNTLTKNVPNRYLLVNVVARRARQIAEDAEMEGIHLTEKPVTEAINEVADGEITAADIDTHINK